MKRILATLSLVLLLGLVSFQALAEETGPPLVLDHMDVVAYDKLIIGEFTSENGLGLVESIQQDNTVYLSLDVYFQPPWTEEVDKVEVDTEQIMLLAQDGSQILPVGYFDYYGQFELSTNWFSEYRPWDWQEKPQPFHYNVVFAVPRDIGPLDLKLGSFVTPIDGTITVKDFPKATDTATIVINSAHFVDKIEREESVGDNDVVSTITDSVGRILAVDMTITPTMGNGSNPDHFFWHTDWIGIACDSGYRGSSLGEEFMDSLSENVSHNLSRSDDGTWSSGDALFYFAVPANTTSFKLIYLGNVAAEGMVQ